MTVHDTEEQRVERLLAPLQDIPPVPYRERRAPTGRRWARPVLVGAACLAVIVAVGAAIFTAGGGSSSQPAATNPTPAPAPTATDGNAPPTGTNTGSVPAAPELGVWFLQDGKLVRVPMADPGSGPGAEQRALEALLAGPPAGYTSQVRPGTKLESFALADTIATIRLSGRTPVDQALEQIVATILDSGAAHWVRFGVEEGLVDRTLASLQPDAAAPVELVRAQYDGTRVQFAGTADTFEANVQLRLVEGTKELAQTFVTATCGTGCRGSYEGAIDVPAGVVLDLDTGKLVGPGGTPVQLEAFTTSAEDGSERDAVRLDITPAGS